MAQFSWVPAFKAISDRICGYEERQSELVTLLQNIGVDKGLTDRLSDGQTGPLSEIDPFTFFSIFMKFGVEKRQTLFASLIEKIGLDIAKPTDFDGVPTAQALKVWLFPYADERQPHMVADLWQLFHQARSGSIDNNLFTRVLAIPHVGFTKLTQCLFYVSPDNFFPIDSQTRPWMEKRDIAPPTQSWDDYQRCLIALKEHFTAPFYALSFEAWSENQNTEFSAQNVMDFLNERFPGTYSGTSHIASYKTDSNRELALDPGNGSTNKKSIKVFVDALPPSELSLDFTDYPPEKSRNHHLRTHASSLSVGRQAYAVTIKSMNQLAQLCDWYESDAISPSVTQTNTEQTMAGQPLNQILYGPPGTGKTYATTEMAVQLAEPEWFAREAQKDQDEKRRRQAIKAKYDELVAADRIAFTTFHQSFSYEDFIEGIRADVKDNSVGYRIEDGVFKRIALAASRGTTDPGVLGLAAEPRIWKISIGERNETQLRQKYISRGEARIGWNDTGDLEVDYDSRDETARTYWDQLSSKNQTTISYFYDGIKVGDVLLCLRDKSTVQAIGIVTSDYRYDPSDAETGYVHVRDVNWLLTDIDFNILPLNDDTRLVQQTVYPLDRMSWNDIVAELPRQHITLPKVLEPSAQAHNAPNYVMIIDEINRGNIARIFGELITLLEDDKRKGGTDARRVKLPYSKKDFSVPSNLYVLGTMNTADKSLTQLDLALRRRFEFLECLPEPDLLEGVSVHGVDMSTLLRTLNQRVEVLLDRDHLIGHSYFWSLREIEDEQEKAQALARIFEKKVIPLLQEYFFADWERISWVLNDLDKPETLQFVQSVNSGRELSILFSSSISEQLSDRRYRINRDALFEADAYRLTLSAGG